MLLKLEEWNGVLDYATSAFNILKDEGVNCTMNTYRALSGGKGISFRLVDKYGDLHEIFSTGVWPTSEEYIKAIDSMAKRIRLA